MILNRNSCSIILRRAATHGLTNPASKSSTQKRWDIKKHIVIKANIKQNPLHSIRTSNQRISCTLWIIPCTNGKVFFGHHNMKKNITSFKHSSKIFYRPPTQLFTSPSSSPPSLVKARTSSPPGRRRRPRSSTTMMSSSQVGTSLGQLPHLTCLHLLPWASGPAFKGLFISGREEVGSSNTQVYLF